MVNFPPDIYSSHRTFQINFITIALRVYHVNIYGSVFEFCNERFKQYLLFFTNQFMWDVSRKFSLLLTEYVALKEKPLKFNSKT